MDRDCILDLAITQERWAIAANPSDNCSLRYLHADNINNQRSVIYPKYGNDHNISFLPAALACHLQATGRIHDEFLCLLLARLRESEQFFLLTGQLTKPNQDNVFTQRAAFVEPST